MARSILTTLAQAADPLLGGGLSEAGIAHLSSSAPLLLSELQLGEALIGSVDDEYRKALTPSAFNDETLINIYRQDVAPVLESADGMEAGELTDPKEREQTALSIVKLLVLTSHPKGRVNDEAKLPDGSSIHFSQVATEILLRHQLGPEIRKMMGEEGGVAEAAPLSGELTALRRENEDLRQENAQLRAQLAPKEKARQNELKLTAGSGIDKGKQRDHQEDALFVTRHPDKCALYVIADGMGGHKKGEFASGTVVGQCQKFDNDSLPELRGRTSQEVLDGVLHNANTQIARANIQTARPEIDKLEKMPQVRKPNDREVNEYIGKVLRLSGTTAVGTVVYERDGEFFATFAWTGDSLGFLFTPDKRYSKRHYEPDFGPKRQLTQVTQPDSLVETMRCQGIIKEEEMETHPQKNVIRKNLGAIESRDQQLVAADFQPQQVEVPVKKGDVLFLCSDGIQAAGITHERIETILQEVSAGKLTPQQATDAFIKEANQRGGPDNISVIIVKVGS